MNIRRWPNLIIIAVLMTLAACQTSADQPTPTTAPTAASAEIQATTPANGETAPTPLPDTNGVAEVVSSPTPSPVADTPTPEPTATPEPSPTPSGPITYTFRVLTSYPHDANAWTQGLVIDNGTLFEGTGDWGHSSLREVALETGAVLRSLPLSDEYYGEGITVLGDRIYQLTWQNNVGFVYDRNTFDLLQTFEYPTEGWGITDDGQRLIVSDGTSNIYFWDPDTLTEIGRLQVHDNNGPVIRLNELEYINGEIWANIWLEDKIARISPETGDVLGWIDMSNLLDRSNLEQPADVLNGIAYDEATGRLYVTGKYWPALFEIEVIPTS
ncbi:MAG: glutaminyl-peptide cyclotransferase [Chloroflexota bacterium]